MLKIYHNPRCGKSREALQLLENSGNDFEIVKYLEEVPSFKELSEIIKKLQIKPINLIRQKERIWTENFKGKNLSDDEIIQAMISNPILMERPIVINGDKIAIGRPIENIAKIL